MELLENTTDKRRLFGRWFARRITTYVAVCAFLTFVNWYTSPHYWWVVWHITLHHYTVYLREDLKEFQIFLLL